MQPTFGGAWLGIVYLAQDSRMDFHYKHKRRHVANKEYKPQPRF